MIPIKTKNCFLFGESNSYHQIDNAHLQKIIIIRKSPAIKHFNLVDADVIRLVKYAFFTHLKKQSS